MKNNTSKKQKMIAQRIVTLEKEIRLGKDVQENLAKIENITSALSLEDMLIIDEYIQRKNMLTK